MSTRNLVRHHGTLGAHGPEGGRLYASMPMALARDTELSAYARAVAVFVWSHDEKWQQSATAVADALKLNRKTVTAALAELQEHGWLVREIHYAPGKTRSAWERWHLQMTNRPFTPEEIRELATPEGVRQTDTFPGEVSATRTHRCPPHGHIGGYQTDTIEVQSGVHPEVHSSSARTYLDETVPDVRSRADAGIREATADRRPERVSSEHDRKSCDGTTTSDPATAGSNAVPSAGTAIGEAASASAAEQSDSGWPAESVPAPVESRCNYPDPFEEPRPTWVDEAVARRERAASQLGAGSSGHLPYPDPFAPV